MTDSAVVILIHGIRTAGWWQNRVASIIADKTKAVVIPLKYGYFDLLKFWCPFGWCRDAPIERLRQQIAGIREQYKGRRLVVFAHSYGTYALSRILLENPFFKFDRIILCGSIIQERFDWGRVQNQIIPEEKRNAIINECGLRDVYPVLAKSTSWGYGASGTYGFGDYNVRDRFHPITHSQFFESERIHKYWVPAVTGEPIEFSESDTSEGKTPWWFAILRLPLRWLIIVVLAGLLFAATRTIIVSMADASCPTRTVTNSTDMRGNDGTIFGVHRDFSRGSEPMDRRACGREYWISKDPSSRSYGEKLFYLLDSQGVRRSQKIYGERADGSIFELE